jgi:hypothetical protein
VTNTGTGNLTIAQISLSNNQFTTSNLSTPWTLTVGQSASFTVWLNGATVGSASGTLSLTSSDGVTSPPVALSGTVIAAPQHCDVSFHPGDNIQSQVDANPTGTTFCFRSGVYQLSQGLVPKDNDNFIGEPGAVLVPSVLMTISGKHGVVMRGLRITSSSHDCLHISGSTQISLENSDIGPCNGNSIVISGGSTINIYDSYIHPEVAVHMGCCDRHDGVFAEGTANLWIQGNVIAYGESNIELIGVNTAKVIGNFLLNPVADLPGPQSRGQNFQAWSNNRNILVEKNYTLASQDTSKYRFADNQQDSINFGGDGTNGIIARNNYITGGHSPSGCGLIADSGADNAQFLNNTLVDTGQCGIGVDDGVNHVVEGNRILNRTPVPGGGNTAMYVWKLHDTDPPCGPVVFSQNIAYAVSPDGTLNSYWDGGGCEPVTFGPDNTLNEAAYAALTPVQEKIPPPLIPPEPWGCIVASPYTSQTTPGPNCAH